MSTLNTLTKVKMVWLASCDEVISFAAWFRCLNVESSYSMAPCTLHVCWFLLHGFLPFEFCLRLRITTSRARSFVQVCTFSPMKLGVLHSVFCDGCMDDLHLVCKSSWTPIPSAPPCWGGTWYNDHCDITTNRGWMISVLWEDAERGNFRRPVTVYRFFLCQRSYAQCFDFYVSQNVVVDN